MIDDPTRRRMFGAFLRARREAIRVDEAGLSGQRRRRTPGLRREEVADLAGVSAVWYMRMEQGRDVSPSPAALVRIARALQLGRAERAHLLELAGRRDPDGTAGRASAQLPEGLSEAAMASRAAAYVLDALWNVRVTNEAASELFADWRGVSEPNLLRYVFLDPAARRFIVGWEERAGRLAAEFRMDAARQPGPASAELVAELAAGSAFFAERWRKQEVLGREGGLRLFGHPERGRLAYRQSTLIPADEPDFKLILLLEAR